jgi:hypothetical protein
MTMYRLYVMDGIGEIGRIEVLAAENDGDAVHLAYERQLLVTCEVWDRDRLVAEIPPQLDRSFG